MASLPSPRAVSCLAVLLTGSAAMGQTRVIEWGTTLEPQATLAGAKALAKSIANPSASNWRAMGDQKRSYRFPEANATIPYRLCVPPSWDGKSKLALVMFLHGAGNTESSYLEQDNKLMIKTANQHGVLLVSAMGHQSSYGTFIRLPAVFGKPDEVAPMLAKRTTATELANQLSEKDVLNVLEIVKAEYPIDTTNVFLTGHSMGSGGTWYLGGKYPDLWRGLAPMSGPFVTETGYPWDRMLKMPILVTEGTMSATIESSRALRDWLKKKSGSFKYKEVVADHAGMVPATLSDVYDHFDSLRATTVGIAPARSHRSIEGSERSVVFADAGSILRIAAPQAQGRDRISLTLLEPSGRVRFSGQADVRDGMAVLERNSLPAGLYLVRFETR